MASPVLAGTKLPELDPNPVPNNVQVDGTVVHTNELNRRKAMLLAQLKALQDLENKTVPGAAPLTPRQRMLDFSEVEAKDPDHHYRIINIRDKDKAAMRIQEGFVRVSEDQGGRPLGDELALMKIPMAKYQERVRSQLDLARFRETAHVQEMTAVAESIAKQMRDIYGIKIDASRILINEG